MAVLALTLGCTGSDKRKENIQSQPSDTIYTQKAAMAVYGYDPVRALQIIDSAVIVGNLSEVWGDVNRARIYSQSQMAEQLDSLLGGPRGVRLDTARAIGERLLQHDSLKTNPKLHQDVLEILIYTARLQEDSVRWLQRSRELVEECRKHGEETKALRTEAELGASLCYSGQQEQGLAKLDSVIAAIGSLELFRFYELDAFIIAAKRKIGVLSTLDREEETLPLARRIIELLDDYELHPDQYHDGSYREPQNDTKRADYIRFYRSQAQGFITTAYAALGDKGNMTEAYEKIERTVRDATAREHQARYRALEQQMQRQEAEARAERSQLTTVIFAILLVAALAALVWYWRQKRIISRKNRVLVKQMKEIDGLTSSETIQTSDSSEGGEEASLYNHLREVILAEQLYLDPRFGRQAIIDKFQLSKERVGAIFSQGSDYSSLTDFVNTCRLNHARQLLTDPQLSIDDVAQQSGFGTRQTFSRNFVRRFGLTPTEFREQQEQS